MHIRMNRDKNSRKKKMGQNIERINDIIQYIRLFSHNLNRKINILLQSGEQSI